MALNHRLEVRLLLEVQMRYHCNVGFQTNDLIFKNLPRQRYVMSMGDGLVWSQEVVGSSPAIPTNIFEFMDKNSFKKNVKEILDMGGTIKFPYKEKINEWFQEISIGTFNNSFLSEKTIKQYILHGVDYTADENFDIVFEKFYSYLKKNIGLIQNQLCEFEDKKVEELLESLDRNNATQKQIDEVTKEILELAKKHNIKDLFED